MCLQGFSYLWDKKDRLEGHLSFGREVTVGKGSVMVLTREGTGQRPSQEAIDACTTQAHMKACTHTYMWTPAHTGRNTYTHMYTWQDLSNLGEGLVELVIFAVCDVLRTVKRGQHRDTK